MGKLNRRTKSLPQDHNDPEIETISLAPHWNLIKNISQGYCFVCDKKFKPKENAFTIVYVGRHKENNEELYRHKRCDALSRNWTKKFKLQ